MFILPFIKSLKYKLIFLSNGVSHFPETTPGDYVLNAGKVLSCVNVWLLHLLSLNYANAQENIQF